jgi:predicted transcriptional regulator
MGEDNPDLLLLTAELAKSYLAGNSISADALPSLINELHQTLIKLNSPEEAAVQGPAVSVRRSIKNDQIICLECGKGHKMLKRHLKTSHDLTVGAYRERWNLPGDYPMVAPDYAERRSKLAKKIGLGQNRRRA